MTEKKSEKSKNQKKPGRIKSMDRKRILTGDRPTGKLHLGHYVGSLKTGLHCRTVMNVFL